MSRNVDVPKDASRSFFGAYGHDPERLLFVVEAEDEVQAHARAVEAASLMKLKEGLPMRLAELDNHPRSVPVLYQAFFKVRPMWSRRVAPSTTTLQ